MSDTTITVTLPTDYVEFLNMFGALNHMTIQGALALIVKTRMDETRALTQRPAAQEVEVDIKSRVSELIAEHGTLRAAARSLNIDVGYLSRLEHGDKVHPSSETLAKIGLRDAGVKYQRLVFLPTQPAAQAGEVDDGDVTGQPGPLPETGWDEVPEDAFRKPSPTAGMNLGERIKHVGGRENAAGYIEFGSVAAVRALVRQYLRDLPAPQQATPFPFIVVADPSISPGEVVAKLDGKEVGRIVGIEAQQAEPAEQDRDDAIRDVVRVADTIDEAARFGVNAGIRLARQGTAATPDPIPMVLHCPRCGMQHIDEADDDNEQTVRDPGLWTNPPHRSHLCHGCGTIWRPADVPTTGVASITTKGKADTWEPSQEQAQQPSSWADGTRAPFEAGPMTASKAAYFMERFKHEEKLLGPNEQKALDFVLAILKAQQPSAAEAEAEVQRIADHVKRYADSVADAVEMAARSGVRAGMALATPKPEPMTDEQAYDLFGVHYQMGIIRAVEAHHGITSTSTKEQQR